MQRSNFIKNTFSNQRAKRAAFERASPLKFPPLYKEDPKILILHVPMKNPNDIVFRTSSNGHFVSSFAWHPKVRSNYSS